MTCGAKPLIPFVIPKSYVHVYPIDQTNTTWIPMNGYRANGRHFLVDSCFSELVNGYTWFVDYKGYPRAHFVADDGKHTKIRVHQLIMGTHNTGKQVDHINQDKLDNRMINLRISNASQQNANVTRVGVSSDFPGVSWYEPRKKWVAQISIDGSTFKLGYFDDEEDAAKAYLLYAVNRDPTAFHPIWLMLFPQSEYDWRV